MTCSHPFDRRKFLFAGAIALGGLLTPRVLARGLERVGVPTYARDLWAMGGWHQFAVEAESAEIGFQALEAAAAAVRRFDQLFSVFDARTSLAHLNQSTTTDIPVDEVVVLKGIDSSIAWARRCDGAFDPTVEPLMRRWGFRDNAREQWSSETPARDFDYSAIDCDLSNGRVYRESSSVQIDPGGWVKGWAAEEAVVAAMLAGAFTVQANCGGDLFRAAQGSERQWTCALRDPRGGRLDVAFEMEHSYASVATSANYESFRTAPDSRVVGHLMDPRTGEPSTSDLLSATVFGHDGLAVDAVASALFVMGVADAQRWLGAHPEFGAVLLTDQWPGDPESVIVRGDVVVRRP